MRLLLFAIAIVAQIRAATPFFQGSFEGAASGWTAARGTATPDSAVTYQGHKSMRVEGAQGADAAVWSAPISLTIGKRYELSGWVKTEQLAVRDLDRTPIAIGAALTMASMPFDVHSESLGATRDWTRVRLRFTATRAEDSVVLEAGTGGAFTGKAWFAGVGIEEIAPRGEWPVDSAIRSYGPAYRYADGGWTYLHVEGQPYERGYQHGQLMSKEIVQYMERCAATIETYGAKESWSMARGTVSALFLHGFDQEILEEMKGIADGASDAGAKWEGRRIDLTDIAVVNTTVEFGELFGAVQVTPSGLEGLHLQPPTAGASKAAMDHCSAFAATGKATRDGRMVIGHVTWWPLTLAEQTNVMLDIKPAKGHRMLIQSYPGGIESGTDWYQNDAGIVLTETTIRQTPFNREGTPVAYRARRAIQYSDSIDQVVAALSEKNNGLYTNEWLIGDAKTNEIAMFELGTYKTKLYRSSKNEWFGGTEGFYWGDNNVKDLGVRLEYQVDPKGAPTYVPYVPEPRDLKWQELYRQYAGKIDEQFGFLAFRTAPLVSSSTMDAKVATADMASHMMVWAEFGKPNQREWVPSPGEKENYEKNDGLYNAGYRMIAAQPDGFAAEHSAESAAPLVPPAATESGIPADRLWKGWILPASEADTWFVAGSAAYYQDLQSRDVAQAMAAHWAEYRRIGDTPQDPMERASLEWHKGAIFLDQLRRQLGDNRFLNLMTDFFVANTTKTVTAQSFLDAAHVKLEMPADKGGPRYLEGDLRARLATALIVYGTVREAGANRYAAEQLQKRFLDWFEDAVPIRKDFELTDEDLRTHDVVFVGRAETDSTLAAWAQKLKLDSDGGLFHEGKIIHASENEALMLAATNPLDAKHMVLIYDGNSALATVKLTHADLGRFEYSVHDSSGETKSGFLALNPF